MEVFSETVVAGRGHEYEVLNYSSAQIDESFKYMDNLQ